MTICGECGGDQVAEGQEMCLECLEAEARKGRELSLFIAEPTDKLGEARYVEVMATRTNLIVSASGVIENTVDIVELLRSVADQLDAEACS